MLKKMRLSLLAGSLASAVILLICFPVGQAPQSKASISFSFVYPIVYPRVSSKFGMRKHPIYKVRRHHKGLDLVAPPGTPIRAIAAGTVIFSDPYAGYGNLVVVKHRNGITSHYGHCKEIKTNIGKVVRPGEIIATLGNTGSSTGPHLHLEIRKNGVALDPLKLLPGVQAQAEG